MLKKYLSVFSILIFSQSAYPADSIKLPEYKFKQNQESIKMNITQHSSDFGYDFTGFGKPNHYDSIYYNTHVEDRRYQLFQQYPTIIIPTIRGKGR